MVCFYRLAAYYLCRVVSFIFSSSYISLLFRLLFSCCIFGGMDGFYECNRQQNKIQCKKTDQQNIEYWVHSDKMTDMIVPGVGEGRNELTGGSGWSICLLWSSWSPWPNHDARAEWLSEAKTVHLDGAPKQSDCYMPRLWGRKIN